MADQRKLFLLAAHSESDGLSRTCGLQKFQDLLLTLVWNQAAIWRLALLCQKRLAKGSWGMREHSMYWFHPGIMRGVRSTYVMVMLMLWHWRSWTNTFFFSKWVLWALLLLVKMYNISLVINRIIIFGITKSSLHMLYLCMWSQLGESQKQEIIFCLKMNAPCPRFPYQYIYIYIYVCVYHVIFFNYWKCNLSFSLDFEIPNLSLNARLCYWQWIPQIILFS